MATTNFWTLDLTSSTMSPKGFSFFYPTLPIFSFIAIILMALLFPGFYRTRSIALMSLWTWVYFLNLFTCINMILWRSSVDDLAPVYCDIGENSLLMVVWMAFTHQRQWLRLWPPLLLEFQRVYSASHDLFGNYHTLLPCSKYTKTYVFSGQKVIIANSL